MRAVKEQIGEVSSGWLWTDYFLFAFTRLLVGCSSVHGAMEEEIGSYARVLVRRVN
jgi:hypothetical protein